MENTTVSVRILYLDDNPSDAKLIEALIGVDNPELSTSVESVFTKEAFLAALRSGNFDLILSDYRMPGYEGDEALRDAKAIRPDVPFLMVTGALGEVRAVETLKAGATDYVLKDRVRRLVPSIKRAIKHAVLERERRETDRRLVEAQRIAHIGNWEYNIQTGKLHWSEELYSIYGLDPDSSAATIDSFARFVHPEDREFVNEKMSQVFTSGVSVNFDFRIIAPNGSLHFLQTIGEVRELDSDGKPLIMAGTNQDITERKRAEEELRRTAEELKQAQRIAHMGSWHWDLRTHKITVSEELHRLYGLDPSKPFPDLKALEQMMTPASWKRIGVAVAHTMERCEPYEVDLEMRHCDGNTVWVTARGDVVRNDKGQIIALRGTALDITARKQAEEALRISEERLSSVMTNSRDVIYRVNLLTGKYEYISPAAQEMVGYSAEELMVLDSESALAMIQPDDLPAMRAALASLETNGRAEAEYRQRTKDGGFRWLSNRMTLTRDNVGRPQYRTGNIRDITENKQAEELLKASEENLRLMVSHAADAMMVLDKGGVITAVSPLGARLLGYEESEVVGKGAVEFADSFSRLEVVLRLEELHKRATGSTTTSSRIKTKSGEVQLMSLSIRLINPGTSMEKYFVRFSKLDLSSGLK